MSLRVNIPYNYSTYINNDKTVTKESKDNALLFWKETMIPNDYAFVASSIIDNEDGSLNLCKTIAIDNAFGKIISIDKETMLVEIIDTYIDIYNNMKNPSIMIAYLSKDLNNQKEYMIEKILFFYINDYNTKEVNNMDEYGMPLSDEELEESAIQDTIDDCLSGLND